MTLEAAFQAEVIDLAHLFGWKVAHFRPAMTKHGWRTPVAADGKGFPDLLLVRDRVIAAELKSDRGRLSHDQEAWLGTFEAAGVEVYEWHPCDLEQVAKVLRRRAA